jgi:hypothetical protein
MIKITTLEKIEPLLKSSYFYIKGNNIISHNNSIRLLNYNHIDGLFVYDRNKLKTEWDKIKINTCILGVDTENKKLVFTFCFTKIIEIPYLFFSDTEKSKLLDCDNIGEIISETFVVGNKKIVSRNRTEFTMYENDVQIPLDIYPLSDISHIFFDKPLVTQTTYDFKKSIDLLLIHNKFYESHLFKNYYLIKEYNHKNEYLRMFIISKNVIKTYIHYNLTITIKNSDVSMIVSNSVVEPENHKKILTEMLKINDVSQLDSVIQPIIVYKTNVIKNSIAVIGFLDIPYKSLNFNEISTGDFKTDDTEHFDLKIRHKKIRINFYDILTTFIESNKKKSDPIIELMKLNTNEIGLKEFSLFNVIRWFNQEV